MTDAEFLRKLADTMIVQIDPNSSARRLREIAGRLAQPTQYTCGCDTLPWCSIHGSPMQDVINPRLTARVPPREPTEAMIKAGHDYGIGTSVIEIWRVMWDAAQPPSAPAEHGPVRDGYRCEDGRLMRHDPLPDDPNLETDVGPCPECANAANRADDTRSR